MRPAEAMLAIFGLCLTAGCGHSAVEELSTVTAVNVGVVSANLGKLKKTEQEFSTLRIERVEYLEQVVAEGRSRFELDVDAHEAAGFKTRISQYKKLKAFSDKSISAANELESAQAGRRAALVGELNKLSAPSKELGDLAKALTKLSTQDGFLEQASSLFAFVKEIDTKVKAAQAEQAEAAKKAVEAVEKSGEKSNDAKADSTADPNSTADPDSTSDPKLPAEPEE